MLNGSNVLSVKKIMLVAVLAFSSLQAEDVVHYDKREVKKPEMSKPNHPNDNIYINR
ncbi:hypothetical protein [Sulfurimonas sp. HSL-1716]|uniref:hypothetical protein n=1 Tax=Hydrocurvibacter sulfurireducens TaxID=3131937 RepID=UPI0031FA0A67